MKTRTKMPKPIAKIPGWYAVRYGKVIGVYGGEWPHGGRTMTLPNDMGTKAHLECVVRIYEDGKKEGGAIRGSQIRQLLGV